MKKTICLTLVLLAVSLSTAMAKNFEILTGEWDYTGFDQLKKLKVGGI